MRAFFLFLAIIIATPAVAQFRDTSIPMVVNTSFRAAPYMGKWFEIARYPNRFERNCVGVTAEYSLRKDRQVDVVNTCFKKSFDGRKTVARGLARVDGPGKLSVTFVPALPFIRGDYWVLYLDENYQLAVIGEPKGKFGWILSRSAKISESQKQAATEALTKNGYTLDQLIWTEQQ